MIRARTKEWVRKVPAGWRDGRLKDFFSYAKGLNITKADLVEDGVAVVSYGQIHAKHNTGTHLDQSLIRYVPEETAVACPNSKLKEGDIVFADTSEDLDGVGNCVLNDSGDEVYAGYHALIARARFPQHSKYLSYLFQTDTWRGQVRTRASGIKVFSLTQRVLNPVTVILPPLPEQKRIAAFLDAKCADIDKAIETKRKQLDCIDEMWKNILYKATTQGLGTARMVKTRNRLFPEIPQGWKIKRLKRICSMRSGDNLGAADILPEGEYPVYGGNGLRGYYSDFNVSGRFILVGRQGALCGNVHLVDGDFWATEHALITTLRPNIEIRYAAYMMDAMNLNQYASQSAAQPGLAASKILNVETVVPSCPEQCEIANYLDAKRKNLDELTDNLRRQIEVLADYRKSLIHECVMGERRVG